MYRKQIQPVAHEEDRLAKDDAAKWLRRKEAELAKAPKRFTPGKPKRPSRKKRMAAKRAVLRSRAKAKKNG